MTTLRPYQAPRSHEQALAELERVAGTQLDPALVTAFGTLDRRALEQVRREHDDMEEAVA